MGDNQYETEGFGLQVCFYPISHVRYLLMFIMHWLLLLLRLFLECKTLGKLEGAAHFQLPTLVLRDNIRVIWHRSRQSAMFTLIRLLCAATCMLLPTSVLCDCLWLPCLPPLLVLSALQQDATKQVTFDELPPVLQLHLKRFEYDAKHDIMFKVNNVLLSRLRLQ